VPAVRLQLFAKMCGWNETERVNVQSVEVKVDAALIEQLRAGYAEMGARRPKFELVASAAMAEAKQVDDGAGEPKIG
jgi:hypothetical protein